MCDSFGRKHIQTNYKKSKDANMRKVIKNCDGYYAVFSYNQEGRFWQQSSKWYFREGYAKRICALQSHKDLIEGKEF